MDSSSGVIDADYTGNIGVLLFNHGSVHYDIDVGDRIAQLICEKISYPRVQEVFEDRPGTCRGASGFGSTGGHWKKTRAIKIS